MSNRVFAVEPASERILGLDGLARYGVCVVTDAVSKSCAFGRMPDNPMRSLPPIAHPCQARSAKVMPRLLSIKQVMFELGIGRTSLYELIAAGKLKTVKIGRRRFVSVVAIDEFIASHSV